MEVEPLSLPDARLIKPVRHGDHRGFFSETFRDSVLHEAGVRLPWVQDNHARSPLPGTLRGLHFQVGASAQAKLLRVSRGAILDVIVDLRHGSPAFGQHLAIPISEDNWQQIYVPVGFAHAYCTLCADTEVQYKVSAYYDPGSERGLAWDDPDLGINWPFPASDIIVSQRDTQHPRLRDLPKHFQYLKETS